MTTTTTVERPMDVSVSDQSVDESLDTTSEDPEKIAEFIQQMQPSKIFFSMVPFSDFALSSRPSQISLTKLLFEFL